MMVSLSGWLVTALTVAFAAESAGPSQQAPDLVLLGGKVFTSDTARPWTEAVAIRGERIVAVGTTADLRRLAGASTRVIDVGGAWSFRVSTTHTTTSWLAARGPTYRWAARRSMPPGTRCSTPCAP